MTKPLHPSSNNNESPSRWFHESAINIDESNNVDDSNSIGDINDIDERNDSERISSLNVAITADTNNDRVCDASNGDNGSTTDCTFEGLGSLQSHYGEIIADCIKNVFGISQPKD